MPGESVGLKKLPRPAAGKRRYLRLSQPVEHFARGEAIWGLADRALEIANGKPGARAKQPIRIADSEATPGEQLLHLITLVHGEDALIARPGLHQGTAAAQPVGKIPGRQRIRPRRGCIS